MIHPFAYKKPHTVEEALAQILAGGVPVAGGTDLIPLLKYEVRTPLSLVDVTALPALRYIHEEGGRLFVGAAVTLATTARDTRIRKRFPALAQAAEATASPQIRSLGTLGGNLLQDRRCIYFNQSHQWRSAIDRCFKTGGTICHQAPASKTCRAGYYGDAATALIALDAVAVVWDEGGRRELPVRVLCEAHGSRNGTSAPDRLLLEGVWLPPTPCLSQFLKVSVRRSLDFPTFNSAAAVYADGSVALAVGAVREYPVLLEKTAALFGTLPDGADTELLLPHAMNEIRALAKPVVEAATTVRAKRESFAQINALLHWAANERIRLDAL